MNKTSVVALSVFFTISLALLLLLVSPMMLAQAQTEEVPGTPEVLGASVTGVTDQFDGAYLCTGDFDPLSCPVSLTWTAASGTVTGYRVYRDTTGDGDHLHEGTDLYYLDPTAQTGNTYTYHVTAYNDVGEGAAKSLEVVMQPHSIDYSTLVITANREETSQYVDLAWAVPIGTVTGYRVERRLQADQTDDDFAEVGDVPADEIDTDVGPVFVDRTTEWNTGYFYRIVPYNGTGDGLAVASIGYTTPPEPAEYTGDFTASAVTASQQALIQYTVYDTDGGSQSSYIHYRTIFRIRRAADGHSWATDCGYTVTPEVVLTGTHAYYTHGSSFNMLGGAGGEQVYSATYEDIEYDDGYLEVSLHDTGTVWSTSYTYCAASATAVYCEDHSGDASYHCDEDLPQADGKYFSGDIASTEASVTIPDEPPPPPGTPQSLTCNQLPNTDDVYLDWIAPGSGGTPDGYNIYRDGNSYTEGTVSATNYTDYYTNYSTSYSYIVKAYNDGGESSTGASCSVTTSAPAIPGSPSSITATLAAPHPNVYLSWPAGTGYITAYYLYRGSTQIYNGQGRTDTDDGTTWGQTYTYEVAACNITGCSTPRASTTVSTPPNTPSSITVTLSSTEPDVVVTWGTATGATGYRILRNNLVVSSPGVNDRTWTDTGTAYSTEYTYAVRGTFNSVDGALRTASSITTADELVVPPAPTGLTIVANPLGSGNIDISWTPPAGEVTGYYVYRTSTGTQLSQVTSGTSYTDTGRTPGATIIYLVAAYNDAGTGPTVSDSYTVPHPLPGAPGSLTTADDTANPPDVILTWTAATGVVSGYHVYSGGYIRNSPPDISGK